MSSKIIDLFGTFKDEKEKDQFLEAQFNTIVNLNKQVDALKAEKAHLERLLKENHPAVDGTTAQPEDGLYQEERICKEQLAILNSLSKERELTTEECRKVDVYAKILLNLRNKPIQKKSPVDQFDTDQLLKLVTDESNSTNN